MVALYPDAEVYRRAMRFFDLRQKPEDAAVLALRVLDLAADDQDAQHQVARYVLRRDSHFSSMRTARGIAEVADIRRLMSIAERAYAAQRLSTVDTIKLADLLEDLDEHAKSFQI